MTLLSTSSIPTSNSSSSFDGYVHLTSDGWLTPVVNPHSYGLEGLQSPEGQAFVVEMYSAWRDWVEDGTKGTNAARSTRMGPGVAGAWTGVGIVSLLLGTVAI